MIPAGTWCASCLKKGHRCQAQIWDDGVASCLPCADGEPCAVERVGAPRPADDAEMFEAEAGHVPAAPAIHRTPEELGIPRTVEGDGSGRLDTSWEMRDARKAVAQAEARKLIRDVEARRERLRRGLPATAAPAKSRDWVLRVHGERVRMSPGVTMGPEVLDPESRNRKEEPAMAKQGVKVDENTVLAIAGTMSDGDVAKQVGCSGTTVGVIRKKHGIARFAGKRGPKAAKAPGEDVARRMTRHVERTAPLTTVRVGAEIDVEEAKRVFAALSAERMAIALNAVLAAVLRAE